MTPIENSQRLRRSACQITDIYVFDVFRPREPVAGGGSRPKLPGPFSVKASWVDLKNNQNAHIHEFNRQNHNVRISTWHYNEYVIWGLTAMIAAEFINTCFDGNVIADMDLIRKGNVNKYR